jgi:hypothetical protein
MTPRSLFIIILKVLGILSLKELIIAITPVISIIFPFLRGYPIADGLFMLVITLLALAANLGVSYILLFKTDVLVTKFGLTDGVSEPLLQLNISNRSILHIAIIVTGFLLLLIEIPDLIRILYTSFSMRKFSYDQGQAFDWSPMIFSIVKIILGLLIIGERKRIITFLDHKPEADQGANV